MPPFACGQRHYAVGLSVCLSVKTNFNNKVEGVNFFSITSSDSIVFRWVGGGGGGAANLNK